MSNTIDERIVSMKFDNKQFEAGANESMSTIDKLLAKLKLTDSAEGFTNLDKAAKGIDLSGLAGGVDAVTNKFSALEAVALGALMNIGNRIANMGIDLAKSLSVDQIATGLNEYEQKMGSVQTLLYNAKFDESIYDTDAKKMEKIKDIMEDLNKYSDDTIYSFGDMKSAIAKFVNAGVELDDASLAIKGIANVAALSGANAQEAGRAYYNLAQSLSTGSLKLIDWKSIENANMASIPFKQTLIDVAREMGALDDDLGNIGGGLKAAEVTAENFRESISGTRGATWVTNEVLLTALAKFGDKTTDIGSKAYKAATEIKTLTMLMDTLRESVQSGWAETFEIIIGDFFEAKDMWTAVSDEVGGILSEQARKRNEFFADWKYYGGRQALLDSITHIWSAIKTVLTEVKAVIDKVFPALSGEQFANITRQFLYFAKGLEFDSVELSRLRLVLNRIIPLFKIVQAAGKGLATIGSAVAKAIGKIMTAFADNVAMTDAGEELNTINDVCEKIADVAGKVAEWIGKAGDEVAGFITALRTGNYVSNFLGKLVSLYDFIRGKLEPLMEKFSFEKIGKALDNYQDYIPTQEQITGAVTDIWDKVKQAFSGQISFSDLFSDFDIFGDSLNTSEVEDKTVMIVNLSDALNSLHDSVKTISDSFQINLDGVAEWFKKIDWGVVTGYAFAVALTMLAFRILKVFDKILVIVGGVAGGLAQIAVSASGFLTRLGKSLKLYITLAAISNALVKLAIAFAIVAFSLKMLTTDVKPEKLKAVSDVMFRYFLTLAGVLALVSILVGIFAKNPIQLSSSGNVLLGVALFVAALAAAIFLLASALSDGEVRNLGPIIEAMTNLLKWMGIFLIAVSVVSSEVAKEGNNVPAMLISLAAAILIVAYSIKTIAEVASTDFEAFVEAESAIIAVILAMSLLMVALSKVKIDPKTYANILSLAGLAIALAAAVYIFSHTDFKALRDNADVAFLSLTVCMGVMILAAHLGWLMENNYKGLIGIATVMVGIGLSLALAASAFYLLAGHEDDWQFPVAFMAGFALVCIAIAEFSHKMESVLDDAKGFAKVMLSVAASLILVVIAFKMVSKMDVSEVLSGTLGLIGPIFGLIAIIIALTHYAGEGEVKAGAGIIISIAALLLVLTASLAILSFLPQTNLAGALSSLMLMSLVIVGLVAMIALIVHGDEGLKSLDKAKAFIISLSVFIGVFAVALTVMSKVADTGNFLPIMISLLGALIVLGVVVGMLSKIKMNKPKETLAAVIMAIVMLAAVTAAVYVLSQNSLNSKNMIMGLIGVGVLMLMLVSLLNLLEEFKIKKPKQTLVAVLLAVVMLTAVTAALYALGQEKLNYKNLLAGMIGIAVILGVLAGILFLLGNITGKGVNMILAATSLILLSVAVGLIAASLWLLAGVPVETIKEVTNSIVIIIAVATLAVIVLGIAKPLVFAAAIGIGALGLALIVLGLGLLSIAAVVPVIGIGMQEIGLGLTAIGEGIVNIADAAVYGSERLPVFFDNLKLAAISLYELLEELKKIGPVIAYDAATVGMMCVTAFLMGVAADLGMVVAAGFLVIIAFIDGVATAIDENGGELQKAIDHLKESIKNFLFGNNGEEYEGWGKMLLNSFLKGVVHADPLTGSVYTTGMKAAPKTEEVTSEPIEVKPEVKASEEVEDAVVETIHAELSNGVTKAGNKPVDLPPEAKKNIANNTMGQVADTIKEDTQVQEAVDNKLSDSIANFNASDYAGLSVQDFISAFTSGIGSGDGTDYASVIMESMGVDSEAFKSIGSEAGSGFVGGLTDAVAEVDIMSFIGNGVTTDSFSGTSGLLSSMFESGSGTTSDPGVITAVLGVDTEVAKGDIWDMMEATQLTKIVGSDVNGKIDATYVSSAEEMAQQEAMMNRVREELEAGIRASINEMPTPETVVNVNLNADAKKMFQMTQDQSTNYRKRTGRSAY